MQVVGNGIEALYYLEGKDSYADRKSYPLPVLILTDLNMPHMTGLELLLWLKQQPNFVHIPVVVMSNAGKKVVSMSLGASSYFDKLSPLDRLIDILKSLLPQPVSSALS